MKTNYCVMCGMAVPHPQKLCSMCYGDPAYGRDGYYEQEMRQRELQYPQDEEPMEFEDHPEER